MIKFAYVILLCCPMTLANAAITPQTVECNFDGANRHKVYSLASATGVGTTFRLPEGWEIQDFVVTNNKSFFGQSNGTVGVVKPLEPNADTSVILSTSNNQCFVFHLTSKPAEEVAALVVVDIHDQNFFNTRVGREVADQVRQKTDALEKEHQAQMEKETAEARQKLLFSLETDYQVKNDCFQVRRVVDDGIFTYILLPGSQDRPAVFVAERNKEKELQPVKYMDLGDYYQVHRVLSGSEKFYLKSGDRTTEISKD